jgi:hypothetical protein
MFHPEFVQGGLGIVDFFFGQQRSTSSGWFVSANVQTLVAVFTSVCEWLPYPTRSGLPGCRDGARGGSNPWRVCDYVRRAAEKKQRQCRSKFCELSRCDPARCLRIECRKNWSKIILQIKIIRGVMGGMY